MTPLRDACPIGLDVGTTTCRAVAFDCHGQLLAEARREVVPEHPAPGEATQQATRWWEAACLVLREVVSETLIVALKGGSMEVRDKILANMSMRAAESLREDLDGRGPMRLSEVEAQQKEILKVVRRLVEEGQVTLGSGAEDSYV